MVNFKPKKLLEGFSANVGDALRSFFSRAPQRQAIELQRGGTSAVSMAGLPYNLVTQFGYDALANYLRIDQDIQQSYTDYEEMDEYPEVSCFGPETAIALPRKHGTDVSHRTIGQLAKDYEDGRHRTLLVYAFDHEAGRVVVAEAKGPVKTGRRQVYRVTYEEYRGKERRTWSIKATYDHLFMLRDGSYRATIDLEPGDRLMPCTFDGEYLNHRVISVERLGEEDVYDLEVPGYHNFAVGDGGDGFVFAHNCGLDIYADDATSPNLEREQSVWAVSEDKATADELNHMLHHQLLIEEDVWGVVRTICKYGNVFGEALVTQDGLVGINYLPPPTVRRLHGPSGELIGYIQDIRGEFNVSLEDFYTLAAQQQAYRDGKGTDKVSSAMGRKPGELTVFEDWELIHWRLRGKHLRSVYGTAVIDPARWVWKRLALLEDALLVYKLERAPARYAFYIDVGELDAERGLAFVNKVKNSFTRQKFVNPNTGKLDMRFNPLAMDEDFFVPVRAGKRTTEIDVISGPDYSETDTLEYHRDKLVSSIKIPKVYMGYGGESTRNALSSEDIRFARTVMRIQRVTRSGYRQAARIHLIAKGMNARADYDIRMNVPSQILELARVEVMSATADLAQRMKEDVGTKWVLMHLYKFSEDEAVAVMKERDQEELDRGRRDADIAKMSQEGVSQEDRNRMLQGDIDMRLSKLITAVSRKDWRRGFDGSRQSERRAEEKLSRVLKESRDTTRRLKELGGLMVEIRGALRSSVTPLM